MIAVEIAEASVRGSDRANTLIGLQIDQSPMGLQFDESVQYSSLPAHLRITVRVPTARA